MADASKYWAFLSYSHSDKAHADWLHRALENYRVPSALVGRRTPVGEVPARLSPIFRDRDELAASDDLGAAVREALSRSRCLVVLCSPTAAASRWTNEEVATFKRLSPDGQVLAAIVGGEPFAGEMPGRESEECFPPALRSRLDAAGNPTGERAEPIASDFREGGDGKRMGLLKLVAGMLGVGLDELARRETQRRQKRLAWLAAAALAGMVVTSGLAVTAIQARDEARAQRREAEGLIGFMLGDLRGRLEPLGRLDVLDAVGAKALAYYETQDKSSLADEGLAQRAKALTLIGEIANLRGDLDGALRRYTEARASTLEAVSRAPDNQQHIFDHAQNVFWVGYIDWQRGRIGRAQAEFREYKRLAARLVALNGNEPKWRLEGVYADTNLGTLQLEKRRFGPAAASFESALREAEKLAASAPNDRQYQDMVSVTLAYLADSQSGGGRLEDALASRERQLALLDRIAAAHGGDANIKRNKLVARQALGHLSAARGDAEAGLAQFRMAAAMADELRQIEPDNTEWLHVAAWVQADLAALLLDLGRLDDAQGLIRSSCDIARRLTQRDSSVVKWRFGRMGECLRLRAQAAAAKGYREEALAIARQAISLASQNRQSLQTRMAPWVVASHLLAGDQLAALGKPEAARSHWTSALDAGRLDSAPSEQFQQFLLLQRLGRRDETSKVATELDAIGYRYPRYLQERSRI